MPTFLDESGDVGPSEKSSPFFRIAAVWFPDDDHVQSCVDAITVLRRDKLKLPDSFEFHFSTNSQRQKKSFFETISKHNFLFFMSSFDKSNYDRTTLTKGTIRDSTIEGLVGALKDTYRCAESRKVGRAGLNERVVFDECDDPDYVRALNVHFKVLGSARGRNEKLIRSIKPSRSRSDLRIQIVDMACGAIRLHLGGDDTYYASIEGQYGSVIHI